MEWLTGSSCVQNNKLRGSGYSTSQLLNKTIQFNLQQGSTHKDDGSRLESIAWHHKTNSCRKNVCPDPNAYGVQGEFCFLINIALSYKTHFYGSEHIRYRTAMSKPRPSGCLWPSRRLCAAQFRFRYSKTSLHSDNLSLLWWSLIWHLWCRLSYVPFYHIYYHCSYDSNAFSILS